MEDTVLEEDQNSNPQLTEKIFIKSEYVFVIDSMIEKNDNIISTALKNIKTYESYFNKFNHFALIFHFLSSKERNLHCSHEIRLRTKLT